MSLEDFQLEDNETSDNSILKRDFSKTYHQLAANLKDFDQKIEFNCGKNKECHQIANAYLQYEMAKEEDVAVAANRVLVDWDPFGLVKNAFANCFYQARSSTRRGRVVI